MNKEPVDTSEIVREILRMHSERSSDLLRSLVTDEVIAEHRLAPLAPSKTPALRAILDVMRQAPVAGKLAILALRPGSEYQIIRLSGEYGKDNELTDLRRYRDENDALHEVFLRRLDELGVRSRRAIKPDLDVFSWEADQAEIDAFNKSLERYVISYVDRPNATAGESIGLHASADSDTLVQVDLVQLGYGDMLGNVRERIALELGEINVRHQKTTIGSTALVSQPPGVLAKVRSVGLTIMPAFIGEEQTIIGQNAGAEEGWELRLSKLGRVSLIVTGIYEDAAAHQLEVPASLRSGVWYSIAATFSDDKISLAVYSTIPTASAAGAESSTLRHLIGKPATTAAAGLTLPDTPIRFSGRVSEGGLEDCFDGKIEAPYLSASEEISALVEHRALLKPSEEIPGLIVRWCPSDALSEPELVGQIIPARGSKLQPLPHFDAVCLNSPMFAVTSSSWDGTIMDYSRNPKLWNAVYFHSDDLDDCRWERVLSVELPPQLASGAYAVRMSKNGEALDYAPFFVEPTAPNSGVAVIIPTASYVAYGNDHPGTQGQMAQATASRTPVLLWGDIFMQLHPELGRSCYDSHRDGSGVGVATWRRPLLNMRPTHRYHVGAWQFPADLKLLSWLEDEDIHVDVITDHSLHERGREILERYSTVMTATHSEYYSSQMLDAVEGWITGGGRFLYLGANGFYWRCAFPPDRPWLFELRRGETGSRAWESRPGELHHAFTGEQGGLWKSQGRSPHRIFGVGFCSQGFDSSGWYRRLASSFDSRVNFIFEGLEGETFGKAGLEGGGAAGQEVDRFDADLGSPADALILATSEGLSDGYLRAVEEIRFLVSGTSATSDPFVRADMTYFVNDSGGAVFSTGSIAWCGSLGEDPGVSQITRNVLRRFSDPSPLTW